MMMISRAIRITFPGTAAAMTALAAPPSYSIDQTVPAPGCTSVDLSTDESLLFIRSDIGGPEGGLAVIDTADYSTVQTCPDIPSTPWKFRIDEAGDYAWCTRYYSGSVSKIDWRTCQIVEDFSVGSWPVDLIFDASRRYLYVGENHPGGSNSPAEGSIQIIDTWTDQALGGISLHGQPGTLTIAPMDRYLYALSANMAANSARLYKIDTVTQSTVATVDLPWTDGSVGISVQPDGDRVYVPRPFDDEVLVVDTNSMTIVNQLVIEAPFVVAVAPDGDHALVLHQDLAIISVLDLQTGEVDSTIDLNSAHGDWKREVVWTSCASKAYVAHGDSVIVLSAEFSCPADLDGDGDVDADDFFAYLDLFVLGCP